MWEIYQLAAPHSCPTRDLACIPGMCPDWESNQWPFGWQAGTQATEPHQPGQDFYTENHVICKKMTLLLLHSQFVCLLFLSLAWLPCLGLPVLCWIRVTRVDIPVLFLILEDKLSVFTIEYDISWGFVIYSFYYVEVLSFHTHFIECFNHKAFYQMYFCIYWCDHMILIFDFVNVVYRIDWSATVEPSQCPCNQPHLIVMHSWRDFLKCGVFFLP